MGLGRGLASLISRRETDTSPDDILEQIDSMEEETNEAPAQSLLEDFEELTPDEPMVVPSKPLVTPISIEPEAKQAPRKVSVAAIEDDVLEEEEEPVVPEVPEKPVQPEAIEPEALVVQKEEDTGRLEGEMWDQHEESVTHLAIGDITINPLQPRRTFDSMEMQDLKESIARNGILQPLVVHRLENGKYELIAGERRLRAAKSLKWDKVPCVVRKEIKSDTSRLVYALIENIQRENLNPIEEAEGYMRLNRDFGLSHEEIAERVGKSRAGITNVVRVLQLPAEIQRGISENKISMGHAKAILMIPDAEKQIRFYHHLVEEGLTVRKAEVRARRIQRVLRGAGAPPRGGQGKIKNPLALKYGPVLEERYGYNATVKQSEDMHYFEVVFRVNNEPDLEVLVGRLAGTQELPPHDLDQDVIEG
jgi:ParB/RepB/Spo0J family partition protein